MSTAPLRGTRIAHIGVAVGSIEAILPFYRDLLGMAEVSLDEDDWVYEGYAYAVWDGVEHAGGERAASLLPDDPSGDPWPEEDVYEMYPALAAKYG